MHAEDGVQHDAAEQCERLRVRALAGGACARQDGQTGGGGPRKRCAVLRLGRGAPAPVSAKEGRGPLQCASGSVRGRCAGDGRAARRGHRLGGPRVGRREHHPSLEHAQPHESGEGAAEHRVLVAVRALHVVRGADRARGLAANAVAERQAADGDEVRRLACSLRQSRALCRHKERAHVGGRRGSAAMRGAPELAVHTTAIERAEGTRVPPGSETLGHKHIVELSAPHAV